MSVSEPYFKSARQTRFFLRGRRILLRTLITVARARGATFLYTARIQLAANDGVLDTNILHPASAKHHHRVLLQVVTFAGDVGGHFHAVSETNASDLTDSGVRLARCLSRHLRANAAFERRRIKSGAILERIKTASERRLTRLRRFVLTSSLGQLIDCGHLIRNPRTRDTRTIYVEAKKSKFSVRFLFSLPWLTLLFVCHVCEEFSHPCCFPV